MEINKVIERVIDWTAISAKKKTGEIHFGRLSEFLKTIQMPEPAVRAAIAAARKRNTNACKVGEWVFHWYYIDDIRTHLTNKKVPISVRTERFKVESVRDPKEGDQYDQTFDSMLKAFGVR